jgi:hypothetical protein
MTTDLSTLPADAAYGVSCIPSDFFATIPSADPVGDLLYLLPLDRAAQIASPEPVRVAAGLAIYVAAIACQMPASLLELEPVTGFVNSLFGTNSFDQKINDAIKVMRRIKDAAPPDDAQKIESLIVWARGAQPAARAAYRARTHAASAG